MRTVVASVRVQHDGFAYTAEMREDPMRVDVWRGVEWLGQWAWENGKITHRLEGNLRRRMTVRTQGVIQEAFHKLDMGAYAPKAGT